VSRLESALHEDASFRSDSDALVLAIVIGIANRFIDRRAFEHTRLNRLALIETETQLSFLDCRFLGGRRRRRRRASSEQDRNSQRNDHDPAPPNPANV
jgi:hypothetical protein